MVPIGEVNNVNDLAYILGWVFANALFCNAIGIPYWKKMN